MIAHEMGDITVTSGPLIDKPSDLAGILTNLKAKDILFIDEIHRLPSSVEEYLYPAMEDFSSTFARFRPQSRPVQTCQSPSPHWGHHTHGPLNLAHAPFPSSAVA